VKSNQEDKRTLRVASAQFESSPGDKEANFRKIEVFVERAARQNVRMIIFPECCITGYWFIRNLPGHELKKLAEPIYEGPSTRHLVELAKKFGMTIGAGLVETTASGELYNSYVVAMSDGSAQRHRKLHAFEHLSMLSGSEYTVFDIPDGFRVGVLICYDCNILENVRVTALRGAEILIAPHQTGGCRSKNRHLMGVIDRRVWEDRHANPETVEQEFRSDKGRGWLMRWLPSRAHDNGLFLIFSNGVGVDDDEIRTGNAMVLDPYGEIIRETREAGDAMVVADLDASLLPTSSGRRWLRARRPELYALLTQRSGNEQETRKVRFGE
jgi:predicted amidohydrolase